MPLSEHLAYLVLFALVLLAACGLGRLALGPEAAYGPARATIAHTLFGFFVLSVSFSLALLLDASFDTAALIATVVGVLGLAGWALGFVRRPDARAAMLAVWLTGVVALAAVSWLPVDENATDAVGYAFLSTTALHGQWVTQNLADTPLAELAGTNPLYAGSRGTAIGLLWPWTALGLGVGPDTVAEVSQWLVMIGLLLAIDVLSATGCPPLASVLLAAGGLAGFSEDAALGGGQIGQAFGSLAAIAALWLDRYLLAGWARTFALGMVGYVVATGYPEFLAALPLYVGCLFLLRPRAWRSVAAACAAVTAGVILAEIVTRGGLLDYLLYQVRVSPQARAFPEDPRTVLDVWQLVLLQRPFSRWMLPLLVPLGAYVAYVARKRVLARRSLLVLDAVTLVGAVVVFGALTWAALHADNANYATFKMSGWVGPALFLGGWALAGVLSGHAQRIVAAGLLLLASYRTLGFVWSAASLVAANLPGEGRAATWYITRTAQDCSLQVMQTQPTVPALETAIAESAAPRLGCSLPRQ